MKQFCMLLSLSVVLLANLFGTVGAQVKKSDSLALVDLYNSTDGANWLNNTNWLTDAPLSTWYGVYVPGVRVTQLRLGGNNLKGKIPASIGNLSTLQWLDLVDNKLSGPIPKSLGNLVHLKIFALSYNQLSGRIPATLANLTELTSLDLSNNRLQGPIPVFGKFQKIRDISLNDNRLTGPFPDYIGALYNLRYLLLQNNQLNGEFPTEFRNLGLLYVLDISHNQFYQDSNVVLEFPKYPSSKNFTLYGNYNLFTFNMLESVAAKFPDAFYAPQANIPVHQDGNTLYVKAGGTLSNNTYNWFKVGETGSTTIHGDSTFTPTQSGMYYVHVTNAVATKLTLYSDIIDYTMNSFTANTRSAADKTIAANKQSFVFYPNPAKTMVKLQLNGSAVFAITNTGGKTILTKTINNTGEINISRLSNGTYFIRNNTTGESRKLIVTH